MNSHQPLLLSALLALSSGAFAQIKTECHTNAVPMQLTNFMRTTSVPKFDPNLGHLIGVELRAVATIRGRSRIESLDAAPSVVNTSFAANIVVRQGDLPLFMVMIPIADFSDSMTAFDGQLDYAGTSGITHDNIEAFDEFIADVDPTPENLAAFTGAGMVDFMAEAAGNSSAEGAGNLLTEFETSAGVEVRVCYTFLGNNPPTVDCPGPLMASVGVPVQFQVCATDPDMGDSVTLNGVLPAGATANPPFPVVGNPACTTITWTPGPDQVGESQFVFTANDSLDSTATCTTFVGTAECHMVFGVGGGNSSATIFGHLYDTQLARVRLSYPVTLIDMPSFPLRSLPPITTVQVLMYNPMLFPTNPSQWSHALTITRQSDHTITTSYSGTENGLTIQAELYNEVGLTTRIRFPFTILGL